MVPGRRGKARRGACFRKQAQEVPVGAREGLLQARILEFELLRPIDRVFETPAGHSHGVPQQPIKERIV